MRFADDILMGFQYRADAERFRQELEERMGRFNLELHPEKTRLLEFGRYAAENRERHGEGKPETFATEAKGRRAAAVETMRNKSRRSHAMGHLPKPI